MLSNRVAVITTSTKPWENEIWEVASQNVEDLLLIAGADGRGDLRELNVEHKVLRQIDFHRGLLYRHLVGLRRSLKEFRPDLIHVNTEAWSVLAIEICNMGYPFIIHGAENIWNHGHRAEQIARHQISKRTLARSSGYASWNDAGVHYVRAEHAYQKPTSVFPAIIPSRGFWGVEYCGTLGTPVVVVAGRLIASKGVQIVIQAAAELRRRGKPIRVEVYGAGECESTLSQLAQNLNVDVAFFGNVSASRLAQALSRASCFVQASLPTADWDEQFGRGVAEAMAVGIPVLVSRTGALPEVVGFAASALFEPGDFVGLSRSLESATYDDHGRKLLIAAQERSASRYSQSAIAQQVEMFWSSVLNGAC